MDNNVMVAVRIRPQIPKEVIDLCKVCTRVPPDEPQVWLGTDKAFTFDNVFDSFTKQQNVYESCVEKLIDGCFEGYNATVLAYGQTGSGKTYTMGTGFDMGSTNYEKGIIPRAVEHLFSGINKIQKLARDNGEAIPEFKVNAQFLELYNEDIIDLLIDAPSKHSQIKIHEDSSGGIYLNGVTTRPVHNIEETLQCLKIGALSRTTASTQMNAQSSRSHAIFTLHIKQHRVAKIEPDLLENGNEVQLNDVIGSHEFETLTAKFHFVDLAGSERLKRTGATGERAREGISINSGLLALGNVISALGDKQKRATHVPYRDSKLTRLLQDSLGGNSMTLMIACVSPSDRDFMETLNTLRYANRAKNIKNKVTANQDKSSQTITALRREIQMLQIELQEYKQGKRLIDSDGTEKVNDMFHENNMLLSEINNLKTRIKALQETNERLTSRNAELLVEKECNAWIDSNGSGDKVEIRDIIHGYIKEIEEHRTKLMEMEETCSQLRKQVQRNYTQRHSLSPYLSGAAVAMSGHYDIGYEAETASTNEVICEAKKDLAKMKRLTRNASKSMRRDSNPDSNGNDIEINDENSAVNGENEDNENSLSDSDESNNSDEFDNEEEAQNAVNNAESALIDLISEISVKEKLITELEKSQRKLNSMKQHYEEKLTQLQNKITDTESERDRVLAKLNSLGNQGDDNAKRVREEYQKKLNNLQTEMKKLQTAKREHSQAMRNQANYENQMKQLRHEVTEMKKQKVKLVSKMKEETQKHREAEMRTNKKIAQLAKQERQKDVKIRSLEVESNRFKNLLKRKDDEVFALKKRVKPMSDRVAGRVAFSNQMKKRATMFSPIAAKQKWQRLENDINKIVLSKQNISVHEKSMERYLQQRQQLSRALEKTTKKYELALREGKDEQIIREIQEEIELIEANLKYLNENIDEIQSTILQIEDAKDVDNIDVTNFTSCVQLDEIKYLFDKVLAMVINQSILLAQKEEEKKEYELKYKQVADSSLIQEQLLHHVLDTTFINEPMLQINDDYPTKYDNEIQSNSHQLLFSNDNHIPQPLSNITNTTTTLSDNSNCRLEKARRLTKTPQELLFETSMAVDRRDDQKRNDVMTQSLVTPNILCVESDIYRVPSAPSLKEHVCLAPKSDLFHSPSFKRKTYDRLPILEQTRRLRTATLSCGNSFSNQPITYASRQLSTELNESTPPNSPPLIRRNRDENVFSRLTSGTITNNQINYDRAGLIVPFTGRLAFDKSSPLSCTHVAEGHTRAVLSVVATNDVLFSGSKDCSLKIWDLHTGQEIQSLCDHPDSVQVVRYNEYSRLAFSVSKSFIKIWDPRDNPARCVKMLNSSGIVNNSVAFNTSALTAGESPILDIQLSTYGTTLFSTCSRIVRVWDLRMFHCTGKLNTGHTAGIICMAVEEAGVDNNLVVTGSKDHYIKVFEVMETMGGIHNPKATLKPPHYDGIEALAIHGDTLFSSSRDACIKKWDLPNQKLVYSLNNCHKDWVLALNVMPNNNTLISGCRSGQLKLWSTDNCQNIGDIKAHSSAIHSIATNSSLVFTASSDNTINLWRFKSSAEPSPDCDSGD